MWCQTCKDSIFYFFKKTSKTQSKTVTCFQKELKNPHTSNKLTLELCRTSKWNLPGALKHKESKSNPYIV